MEENKENAKQLAKLGAKAWLKAVTAPVTAAISSALLAILPYILIGVVIIILCLGFYYAASEQIDQVMTTSGELGERMGNAISLHGFRTNEEVEHDEQYKFMFMLTLYKKIFKFSDSDLTLLNQTLLFEGSNEERIYLSENTTKEVEDDVDLENPLSVVWSFIKNISTNYQRGFLTAYAGQSQYLKANKNMFVNAIALKKCKSLTENYSSGSSINLSNALTQCYEGYLVAEYNYYKDWLIDQGDDSVETGIKEGYLVLAAPFAELAEKYDFGVATSLANGFGHFLGMQQDILAFRNNMMRMLGGFSLANTMVNKFSEFQANFSDALNIVFFGELATEETKHFYYDGYITQNLKEEYKVSRNDFYDEYDVCGDSLNCPTYNDYVNSADLSLFAEYDSSIGDYIAGFFDPNVINEETKNREETAELIIDEVYYYYELSRGKTGNRDQDEWLPSTGGGGTAVGTSCSPISKDDLPYFSSPTGNSGCSLTSCFGVYAGGWGCDAHKGIDVNAWGGIYSVCDGVVTWAGMYNDGSASAVEVDCNINGKTYKVRYLHMPMSDVNKWVARINDENPDNDKISSQDYIGQQGAVGNGVSGAHLHLDVSVGGTYVNPESLVGNCSFNHDCGYWRSYCESNNQYYCVK